MSDVTKKSLLVDGIKLCYEEYGSGDPVLFLHGFGASSYSWRHVARSLGDMGWRCICLDLMGFGESDKPENASYTLERQAGLVESFARKLGLKTVHLVGHSYGGGVCLFLVSETLKADSPSLRIRSLTLVDTVCYPQDFPGFINVLRTPLVNWLALNLVPARQASKSILEICYYSKASVTEEAILEYAAGLRSPGAHNALISTASSIIPENMDDLLRSYGMIHIPTLIIWGEKDTIIPLAQGKRLSSEISSSTLTILKNCGHVPQEELPRAVTDNVRVFLRTIK